MFKKLAKKIDQYGRKLDKEFSENVLGMEDGAKLSHAIKHNSHNHKKAVNQLQGKDSSEEKDYSSIDFQSRTKVIENVGIELPLTDAEELDPVEEEYNLLQVIIKELQKGLKYTILNNEEFATKITEKGDIRKLEKSFLAKSLESQETILKTVTEKIQQKNISSVVEETRLMKLNKLPLELANLSEKSIPDSLLTNEQFICKLFFNPKISEIRELEPFFLLKDFESQKAILKGFNTLASLCRIEFPDAVMMANVQFKLYTLIQLEHPTFEREESKTNDNDILRYRDAMTIWSSSSLKSANDNLIDLMGGHASDAILDYQSE